ncbi:MAG: von Willebrand factor type A domain-containing protein [Planctomycetota bacterium]
MSDESRTNDDPHTDLHDAVTDRLLAEAIGGETPPDLKAVILDRAKATPAVERSFSWRRLGAFAAAACLVVGVSTALLLPQVGNPARSVSKRDPAPNFGSTFSATRSAPSPGEPLPVEDSPFSEVAPGSGVAETQSLPVERGSLSSRVASSEAMAPEPVEPATAPAAAAEAPMSFGVDAITVFDGKEAAPATAAAPQVFASGPSRAAAGRSGVQLGTPSTAYAPASPAPTDKLMLRGRVGTPTSQPSLERRLGRVDRTKGAGPNGGFAVQNDRRWFEPQPLGDRYQPIVENPFVVPRGEQALSTFSIDVDTASYANVRQHLQQMRRLPPKDAVRIEELVNYFEYDYAGPAVDDEAPFAASMEAAPCPWAPRHRLVRIGVKGREVEADQRPLSNLVFLVDVSGSMQRANKLPLLVAGLKRLTRRLGENDRVAIVVYASSEGVALPSTSGAERSTILRALDDLRAGGSTAGGAGIRLAYDLAEQNFIRGGVNRVLLCTDGDFNVGLTGTEALAELVETKARETDVFLSVLGFGRGNLNDAMMETVSGKGNGTYAYIDSDREAHRVLVRQMSGTLVTIAKDVKLQVEFNPQHVARYRLIGYENRVMAAQDFNDDTKDAGEIGAGHTVTALYEVVPAGEAGEGTIDDLKYQAEQPESRGQTTGGREPSPELLTLKIRYKQPDGDVSTKLEFPLIDAGKGNDTASADFRFASAVAEFGLLLRDSPHRGAASYEAVIERSEASVGEDRHGDRAEFVGLVRAARQQRERTER